MAAPYYKQKLPTVDFGELNPKQKQFCQARSRYVGYGGARGGGKSHVLRIKALGGALTYPDIRILIVRREYPELEQGIIIPMRKMIPAELATYNGGMHMFTFYNGAIIKFGHYEQVSARGAEARRGRLLGPCDQGGGGRRDGKGLLLCMAEPAAEKQRAGQQAGKNVR